MYNPPDYGIVLEKSNWSYLDLPEYDPNAFLPLTEAQWNGVVPGSVALIDASEVGIEKTVTIPVSLLTPGDYSHIRLRSNKEGKLTQDTMIGGPEAIELYILNVTVTK